MFVRIEPRVDLCHGVSPNDTASDSHRHWMKVVPRAVSHPLARYYPMGGSKFGSSVVSIYPPYHIDSEHTIDSAWAAFLHWNTLDVNGSHVDVANENVVENVTLIALCQFGPAIYTNVSIQDYMVALAVINRTAGAVKCVAEPASPPLKENQERRTERCSCGCIGYGKDSSMTKKCLLTFGRKCMDLTLTDTLTMYKLHNSPQNLHRISSQDRTSLNRIRGGYLVEMRTPLSHMWSLLE